MRLETMEVRTMLTATPIADISQEPVSFEFFEGIYFQDKLVFRGKNGNDLSSARDLWMYDPASGQYTMLGEDIEHEARFGSLAPTEFTVLGNFVYFQGQSESGSQLWRLNPAANNGNGSIEIVEDFGDPNIDSNPSYLTVFDGKLYFQAFTPQTGTELWVFDPAAEGTADQTRLVANLGSNRSSSSPSHLAVLHDKLYFQANDGQAGAELWMFDPQANGGTGSVSIAAEIAVGPSGSSPQELTAFNGKLYFQATTADFGAELWEFDPAANAGAGEARLLSDIHSGADGSLPEELTFAGGRLFFRATDPTIGTELFQFDPALGVSPAWDIDSRVGKSGNPQHLSELNGKLYFQPTGELTTRMQIWEFDPLTDSGSVTLDVSGSNGQFSNLMLSDGKFYFQTTTYPNRRDIYQYDPVQTELLKFTDPERTLSSTPLELTELNGILYFEARTPENSVELWQYDPNGNNGQGKVTSITGDSSVITSNIHEMTSLDGSIYFRLGLPHNEFNLYRYVPGSNIDPQRVLSLPMTPLGSYTNQVTPSGDRLYFVMNDGMHGPEVWEYNPGNGPGASAARRITDLGEAAANANIELQFSHDGKLYFLAGTTSRQLYRFDPTADAGQGQVSIVEDLSGYTPFRVAVVGDTFYFQQGDDLFQYDVTSATEPNSPKLLGSTTSVDMLPDSFVSLGDKVYFVSKNRFNSDAKLYQIDPNAPSDIIALSYTGIDNINPFGHAGNALIANTDRLQFARRDLDSVYYVEMWEMFPEDLGGDGIARRISSINNDGWAAPNQLTLIEGDLYFVAFDDDIGQELFVIPHNPAPLVQGESYQTSEDIELVVESTSLLDNDSDPQGQTLFASLEIGPAHGTLTLNSDGTFRYLPHSNYFGTDEFTYLVTDEGGTSRTAQVEITIIAQPDPAIIQGNLQVVTNEDKQSPISGLLTIIDPDIGEASFQVTTDVQGAFGVFSIQSNGFWTYQLNTAAVQHLTENQSASDSFPVVSLDGTTTESLTITIEGRNDIPALGGETSVITSEESTDVLSGTLTISDTDQGEPFYIPQTGVQGGYGAFSVSALGNWTYQLDNSAAQHVGQNSSVIDSFTVTSLDQSASIVVGVTIHGENDAPSTTIHTIDGVHVEQQLIQIPVSSTDIDSNNAQFTYQYQVIRISDQQTVSSATATNINQFSIAVPSAGDYRIEVTTTDSHGGESTSQRDFTVGTQSTVELSISRDQNAVPGTLQTSAENGLAFHEWEEVAGHLWFTIEEGLPNQPFDFTFELTANNSWLGDPEVLSHLGTDLAWSADGNIFPATLSELDLTGYQVGDQVLLATLLLPKDLENRAGIAMDGQGAYPQVTMQTGIVLTRAQADPLHPFAIQTANNAEFRPVIYDANDDGRVGLADFAEFIASYGREANQDSPDAFRFDYDVSGKVGLSDFAMFVRHYGARKHGNHTFDMPVFDPPPQARQTIKLEDESIDPIVETSEDAPQAFVLPIVGSSNSGHPSDFRSKAPATSSELADVLHPYVNDQLDARVIDAAFQFEGMEPDLPTSVWDDHLIALIAAEELEDSIL